MKKMISGGKLLNGCLRLFLFLGFISFLTVEAHHHHHQEPRIRGLGPVAMKKEGSGKMKHDFVEAVNMAKRKKQKLLEINYTSKRRVPNGPDPIHNRGAGKSHRPPGHA